MSRADLRDVNPTRDLPSLRRIADARVRACACTQWADVYGAFDDAQPCAGIRLVLLMSIRQLLPAGGVARYLAHTARAAEGRGGELPVSTTDGFERAFNPACASGKDGLPARFADNRLARDSDPEFRRGAREFADSPSARSSEFRSRDDNRATFPSDPIDRALFAPSHNG